MPSLQPTSSRGINTAPSESPIASRTRTKSRQLTDAGSTTGLFTTIDDIYGATVDHPRTSGTAAPVTKQDFKPAPVYIEVVSPSPRNSEQVSDPPTVSPEALYPTPPASPDLDVFPTGLPPIADFSLAFAAAGLYTPPIEPIDIDVDSPVSDPEVDTPDGEEELAFHSILARLDSSESLSEQTVEDDKASIILIEEAIRSETVRDSVVTIVRPSSPSSPILPIPILLNTSHFLPHASTFRLGAPTSVLSSLAGNRVLLLDTAQTVWDRMPYSAATAAMMNDGPTEEESVESMLGGKEVEEKTNGKPWRLRDHKSRDHISSIFIHPPTPEREDRPAPTETEQPQASTSTSKRPTFSLPAEDASTSTPPRASSSIPARSMSPSASASSSSSSNFPRSLPAPIHGLPEVRSPPRKQLVLAADSLQINKNRGRRPKIFGFTEMSESSGSSANSSRQVSPERQTASDDTTPTATPVAISSVIQARLDDASARLTAPMSSVPPPRPSPLGPVAIPSPPFLKTLSRAKSETSLPTIPSLASAPLPGVPRRRQSGLKLDFTGISPLPQADDDSASSVITSPYASRLIRKKSGEILKSALKYGGPLGPNGTPLQQPTAIIEEKTSRRYESKSLPATPSCPKYVHFDAQLERVKLFLHDQKPQVVSRDGSPTGDTTSEGEDYPFPSTDEDEGPTKKVLQIKLPNFPTSHAPGSDIYLESLFLEEDRKSLRGVTMCRNLAFQKWVAVRFTLDFWQTTSEVTAQHKETVKGGAYDRFSFSIKLQDFLSRIEEKTLFLALRYHTDGKELWDSNAGQNYQVLFEKVAPPSSALTPKRRNSSIQPGMGAAVGGRLSQWSVTGGSDVDRLADLRAKLSHLTGDDPDNSPPQISPMRPVASSLPRRGGGVNAAGSPVGSPRRGMSTLDVRTSDLPVAGGGLAARYDFGTALKSTRGGKVGGTSSPNGRKPGGGTMDLPDVKTGLLSFAPATNGNASASISKVNNGHAATDFYSPRSDLIKLPSVGGSSPPRSFAQVHDQIFSPAQTPSPSKSDSSGQSTPTPSTGFKEIDTSVKIPAPQIAPIRPAVTENVALSKPKGVINRPSFEMSHTSPPVSVGSHFGKQDVPNHFENAPGPSTDSYFPEQKSAPSLTSSSLGLISDDGKSPFNIPSIVRHDNGSVDDTTSETLSEASVSPTEEVGGSRWEPTLNVERGRSDMSLTSYSSFIEQFCWGGASSSPPGHLPRRASSTSALDAIYEAQAQANGAAPGHTSRSTHYDRPGAHFSPRGTPRSSGDTNTFESFSFFPSLNLDHSRSPGSMSNSSYYTSFTSPPRESTTGVATTAGAGGVAMGSLPSSVSSMRTYSSYGTPPRDYVPLPIGASPTGQPTGSVDRAMADMQGGMAGLGISRGKMGPVAC